MSSSPSSTTAKAPSSKKKKPAPRKAKVHVPPSDAGSTNATPIPQAMIFRRGPVAHSVLQLVADLRLLFSPHSSQRLQERKTNTLKDFLSVAPQLQVTHFLCLTQSEVGVNLRVIRIPQGPTLTFRVVSYSLMRDVAKAQKRPHSPGKELEHPPLVVLNNFSAAAAAAAGDVPKPSSDVSLHLPLLSTVLQHMFPPLHLPTLRLAHCRRVVLLHFDPATQLIDLRHYLITATPANISRTLRHILRGKLDDLSRYDDAADYVKDMEGGKGGVTSDSEGEVGEDSQVELGDRFIGRGNVKGQRSGVRLKELGPRLTLSLLKAEDDFCGGRVLYHHYLSKSEEEVAELKRRKEERRRERERRKREQERNMKRKRGEGEGEGEGEEEGGEVVEGEWGGLEAPQEDDDEAWYEREVGQRPLEGLLNRREGAGERQEARQPRAGKKRRVEEERPQGEEEKKGEEGEGRKKRQGSRRVGAGPRQPWIRGRGGKLNDGGRGGRGGAGRGRGGRGRRGR